MADPHHVPELDGFDRLTVRLYRAGLAAAALGLVALCASLALGRGRPGAELLVLAGALLAVADMHLYDKRIRWVIGLSAHVGSALWAVSAALAATAGPAHVVHHAALGFVFVALSAFALKEQFCFRLPALKLVPLFLAGSLIPLLLGLDLVAAAVLAPAAATYVALAWAKARMPLHFDVGNKAAYQV